MPRFYFDIADGRDLARDEIGVDCPDLPAARAQAQLGLGDLVRDALPDGDQRTFACTVRDGAGSALYRVKLTLTGGPVPPGDGNAVEVPDDAHAKARTLLGDLGQHDALAYTTTKMQDHREAGDLAGAVEWGKVGVAIVDAAGDKT